jgi:hypothetical protein
MRNVLSYLAFWAGCILVGYVVSEIFGTMTAAVTLLAIVLMSIAYSASNSTTPDLAQPRYRGAVTDGDGDGDGDADA